APEGTRKSHIPLLSPGKPAAPRTSSLKNQPSEAVLSRYHPALYLAFMVVANQFHTFGTENTRPFALPGVSIVKPTPPDPPICKRFSGFWVPIPTLPVL